MKILILATLSLILNCGTSLAQASNEHSFDSHMHLMFDDMELLESQLSEYVEHTVGTALVISPSYLVDIGYSSETQINGEDPYSKKEYVYIWNDLTAKFIRKYPGRFLGLCGVHWASDEMDGILSHCLKNKEMIGMKLRFDGGGFDGTARLSNPVNYNRIDLSLKSQSKLKVILIHTSTEDGFTIRDVENYENRILSVDELYQQDVQEIASIVKMARSHPDKNFIIAHSFNSSRLMSVLTERVAESGVNNIYIDISMSYAMDTPESEINKLYSSWRNFGISNILYGTDIVLGADQDDVMIDGKVKRLSIKDALNEKYKSMSKLISNPQDKNKIFHFNKPKAILESL